MPGFLAVLRLFCVVSMLSLPTPICAVAMGDGVQILTGGGVERKAGVDLWTHTEGPPVGVKVNLALSEGEDEEVQAMVAAKEIDRADAGLHQAQVIEKTALEKKDRSDQEHETDMTAAKVADVKLSRLREQLKALDDDISKQKDTISNLGVKKEEDKAAAAMASAKEQKDLEPKFKLVEASYKDAEMKLQDTQQRARNLAMEVVEAKEARNTAVALRDQTQLDNIALRVKLQAAQDQLEHSKFMVLKSKNLKKLADAQLQKEKLKVETQHATKKVASAKEMLGMMESEPAKKEAQASLDRATKKLAETKKGWVEATKLVDKVKNEVNDNETKWLKQVAYKRMMKTATLGAVALSAEKAFNNALSDADKRSSKTALEQVKKEIAVAEKQADTATAAALHVEFDAKQDKQWRDDDFKAEEKQMAEETEKKKENKAADDLAKAALADTGKPPKPKLLD